MYTASQILNMNDTTTNKFLECLKLPSGDYARLRIIIELARQNLIMDVYRADDIRKMNPELVPLFLDNLPDIKYLLPESDPRNTVVGILRHVGAIPNIGTTWLHTIPAEFRIQMIILNQLFKYPTVIALEILSQGYTYTELQDICKNLYRITTNPDTWMPEPLRDKLENLVKFLRRNHIFWNKQTARDIYLKTGTYSYT